MADIDVGVLSLAVPPQSAPKAIYCPAVRVKNYGIQARVASGYVRVYDKFTGQLVLSFDVVSQELDAGQEGNAVSAASWDLTEAEVGKQYIVSGWCSCDGDMVPGNNVLDSTVLTVADTPPPPPPPVEPHASQHEHGGDDQLNLDGLHGQPADPQPYADHASKHQDDGTDQLNISGLAGLAADPQIAADHGNERHVVSFATAADLTNHENDNDTHAAAENLEHVAQKGQVDGYAGLDENGLIAPVNLAPAETELRFLRNDQTWQPGTMPAPMLPRRLQAGIAPAMGLSSGNPAPAEHQHGGMGGVNWCENWDLSGIGAHVCGTSHLANGCLHTSGVVEATAIIRLSGYLVCHNEGAPGLVSLMLYGGRHVGDLLLRSSLAIPVSGELDEDTAFFNFLGLLDSGDPDGYGNFAGHVVSALDRNTPVVAVPWAGSRSLDFHHELVFRVVLSIIGETVVREIRYNFLLEQVGPLGV